MAQHNRYWRGVSVVEGSMCRSQTGSIPDRRNITRLTTYGVTWNFRDRLSLKVFRPGFR